MVLNVQGKGIIGDSNRTAKCLGVTVKRIVLPGLPKLIHMLSRLVQRIDPHTALSLRSEFEGLTNPFCYFMCNQNRTLKERFHSK